MSPRQKINVVIRDGNDDAFQCCHSQPRCIALFYLSKVIFYAFNPIPYENQLSAKKGSFDSRNSNYFSTGNNSSLFCVVLKKSV